MQVSPRKQCEWMLGGWCVHAFYCLNNKTRLTCVNIPSQVRDRREEHQASGGRGGSAQGDQEDGRSQQHDPARRGSPLHDRAAGDAPGI